MRASIKDLPAEPLLVTITEAASIIGRGSSFIYDAIARGIFRAVKSDKRTLIEFASLKKYAAGLPPAKIKLRERAANYSPVLKPASRRAQPRPPQHTRRMQNRG